jgi:hypothetical protein
MINNGCINEKFVKFIETGERSSAPSRLHWLPSQLPVKPTQSTQVAKKDARGSVLSCGGSGGMAVAATTTTTITPTPAMAVAAAQDNRDPFLVSFENYLLGNLDKAYVHTDDETGVYWFNVNQVAYLVEGSGTHDQQSASRKRLGKKINAVSHPPRRCWKSGKGQFCVTCVLSEDKKLRSF